MKKICFLILFLFILNGLFGQTKPEHKWLIGTWNSTYNEEGYNFNETWTFNDNGSGRSQIITTRGRERKEETKEFIFSVAALNLEEVISIFYLENNLIKDNENLSLYRINDQRFVRYVYGDFRIYNKRN